MRRPRAGLRDRWVEHVLTADISRPCVTLLLLLAVKMGDEGKVMIRRKDLADMLKVHEQRIAERVGEARGAGLLDLVEGTGVRGRIAQYVAVIPGHVPPHGTHHVPERGTYQAENRYGLAVRTSGTHSEGPDRQYVPHGGTHNTRAYRSATVPHATGTDRDVPTSNASKDRDEDGAPTRLRLVADSPTRWQR